MLNAELQISQTKMVLGLFLFCYPSPLRWERIRTVQGWFVQEWEVAKLQTMSARSRRSKLQHNRLDNLRMQHEITVYL